MIVDATPRALAQSFSPELLDATRQEDMAIVELRGAALQQVQADWEELYALDRVRTPFLTWPWVCADWQREEGTVVVLAACVGAHRPYVAFLPLRWLSVPVARVLTVPELHLAAAPYADYSGMLAHPDYEQRAVAAFATHIARHLRWDLLRADNVRDDRVVALLTALGSPTIALRAGETLACPYVGLLDDFEDFVNARLGRRSRRALRQNTRRLFALPSMRAEIADATSINRAVATALDLDEARWGPNAKRRAFLERALPAMFSAGMLWLLVLYDDDTPVAASVAITDASRGWFFNYLHAYDARYARLSPGMVASGIAIRAAVEGGYHTFDFLRGAEEYKYRWGSAEARVRFLSATRRGVAPTLRALLRALATSLAAAVLAAAAYRRRLMRPDQDPSTRRNTVGTAAVNARAGRRPAKRFIARR